VKSGVTSILNFAPVVVNVPFGISVRRVDLSVELQIISYHEQRRLTAAAQLRAVNGDGSINATA
jgi:redox-sensing transcriptional repressor